MNAYVSIIRNNKTIAYATSQSPWKHEKKGNETKENHKRHEKTAMEREVAEMPKIAEAEMLVNEWIHEMPEICTWI